ncbi:unnamed protein product [Rangifer tarandus platyrhynchus]|uniref:Uncharacterized protein n=1 Tax=Rangifer tarandus platyrhynchus TaxID=3082113 RepID=A0ABN8YKA3_RANTA|nr:unnamed protein product [Rangifer tarandus platyrhynchus]
MPPQRRLLSITWSAGICGPPPAPTSLWASPGQRCGPGGCEPNFSTNCPRRKSRDPNVCRRCKTAVAAMPSSGMPMPSQDECGKTQDAKEALAVLEKHLNQAFQTCMP